MMLKIFKINSTLHGRQHSEIFSTISKYGKQSNLSKEEPQLQCLQKELQHK